MLETLQRETRADIVRLGEKPVRDNRAESDVDLLVDRDKDQRTPKGSPSLVHKRGVKASPRRARHTLTASVGGISAWPVRC